MAETSIASCTCRKPLSVHPLQNFTETQPDGLPKLKETAGSITSCVCFLPRLKRMSRKLPEAHGPGLWRGTQLFAYKCGHVHTRTAQSDILQQQSLPWTCLHACRRDTSACKLIQTWGLCKAGAEGQHAHLALSCGKLCSSISGVPNHASRRECSA